MRVCLALSGRDLGQPAGAVIAEDATQQQREALLEERPVIVPAGEGRTSLDISGIAQDSCGVDIPQTAAVLQRPAFQEVHGFSLRPVSAAAHAMGTGT